MIVHEEIKVIIRDLEKQIKQMKQDLPKQLRDAYMEGALTALKTINKNSSDQHKYLPENPKDFNKFIKNKYPDYKE